METTGSASAPPNNTIASGPPISGPAAPPPPPPPPLIPQPAVNMSQLHTNGLMCGNCNDRRWFDCDFNSRPVNPYGVLPPCNNCRFHGGSNARCNTGTSINDSLYIQASLNGDKGLPEPKLRTNNPMNPAPTNWQGAPSPLGQPQLPPNLQGAGLIPRLGLIRPGRPRTNNGPSNRGTLAQAYPQVAQAQYQPQGAYPYTPMTGYGQPPNPQSGFSFHFSFPGQGPAAQGQGMQGQDVTMGAQSPQQYPDPQQQTMPQHGPSHGHQQNMQQYGPQQPQQIWQQPQMPAQELIALPPPRQSSSLSPRSTGYLSPSDGFPPPSSPRSIGYLSASEGSSSPEQYADRDDREMLPPSRADSENRIDGRLDNATGGVSLPRQGPRGFEIRGHAARKHADQGNQETVPGQKRNAEEDAAEQDSPKRQDQRNDVSS